MANATTAGTIHADSTGLLYTGRVKVSYILLTSDSAHGEAVLRDGTTSGDSIKFSLRNGTNNDTKTYDFSRNPVVFHNGIYLSALASNAKVMIVTTTAGAST